MPLGVDVGTQFCVSATTNPPDSTVQYNSMRNVYFSLPIDDVARAMLERSGQPFAEQDGRLLLVGDTALDTASMRRMEVERPLRQGMVNNSNIGNALPMLAAVLRLIVPAPKYDGEVLVFTVPSEPVDSKQGVGFHRSAIQEIFTGPLNANWRLGHINEPAALALATLSDRGYTGVAVSFGAGMVNTAFVHNGMPILDFSVARGGDWVDETAAASVGEDISYITQLKEEDNYCLTERASDSVALAIISAYDTFLNYWMQMVAKMFSDYSRRLPRLRQMPMVIAGGTSMAPGFQKLLESKLDALPFKVDEVRMPENPLTAVAQGAYIFAADAESRQA